MEDIKQSDWINARDMNRRPARLASAPKIDQEVSKIVGRPVAVNDPRLIREVIKWRQDSHPDKMDNHLENPNKVKDLKRIFGNG